MFNMFHKKWKTDIPVLLSFFLLA